MLGAEYRLPVASRTVGPPPEQRGGTKIPAARPDDLIALYRAGTPITAIATKTGIDSKRISATLRSAGIQVPRGGPPPRPLDVDVLTDLYVHQRLSSDEVGRRLGCSAQKVRDELRRAGIALRLPGTASALLAGLDDSTLRRLYVDEGKTLAQIAATYDCVPGAVRQRLVRAGISPRPRGGGRRPALDDDATAAQLRRLHLEEGRSITEIARILGWSRDKVGRHLDRSGIPRRPRARPGGLNGRLLRRLYLIERLGVDEIAARLKVSPNHLRNELRRHDIRRTRAPLPLLPGQQALTPALLRRLYVERRLTIAQVAEQTGASVWQVGKALDEAGIARRPRGSRRLPGREPLTAELLQELYVEQGLSSVAIARLLGGHVSRILAAMGRFNIPTRRRPVPGPFPLPATKLRGMYVDEGLGIPELAIRLGVTPNQVRLELRHHAIRRPPSVPPHPPTVAPPPPEVLADLYVRQGLPSAAIAARYHTAAPKARAWLADAGVPVAPRTTRETRTDIDAGLLRELYLDNQLTAEEVGVELDRSLAVVLRALHDHAIPVRIGPRRMAGRDNRIELLNELYADPEVLDLLRRHRIVRRPRPGTLVERFPRPATITTELLRGAYVELGLSARHIELLTGQPADQILDALHDAGLPVRPKGSMSPWRQRLLRSIAPAGRH